MSTQKDSTPQHGRPGQHAHGLPAPTASLSSSLEQPVQGATPSGASNPLSPSFSVETDVKTYNGEVKLEMPGTHNATAGQTMYADPNFSFRILFRDLEPEAEAGPPDFRRPSHRLTTLLSRTGFELDWSGVAPPLHTVASSPSEGTSTSGTPSTTAAPRGTAFPSACSLLDTESQHTLGTMLAILDAFLAAHPHERTILTDAERVPGPISLPMSLSGHTKGLNCGFSGKHFGLVNLILKLFHRAVCWWDVQQGATRPKGAHPWPVPLEGPLVITRIVSSRTENLTGQARLAASAVQPDFALQWPKGRPKENLALGEFHQGLTPQDAFAYTQPKHRPIDPLLPRTHAESATSNTTSSSTTSSAPLQQASNKRKADSSPPLSTAAGKGSSGSGTDSIEPAFPLRAWQRRLSLRLASQLYLQNVTCGSIIGDWGRLMLLYELRRIGGRSGDANADEEKEVEALLKAATASPEAGQQHRLQSKHFALCFARHALHSFVPGIPITEAGPDPDAHVQTLNDTLIGSLDATPSTPATLAPRAGLSFTSRPGLLWGLVHWALHAFQVAVKEGVRPMPCQEHARDLAPRNGAGGRSGAVSTEVPGVPTVEDCVVNPYPFAFGTYANFHPAMLDPAPQDEDRQYSLSDIDRRKMVLKIHRPPLNPKRPNNPPQLLSGDEETVADVCERTSAEIAAYSRLRALQGACIPALVGVVPAHYFPESHAPKLLLERMGVSLHDVATFHPGVYLGWAAQIRERVLRAVAACHQLGVVHGDVHPGNILVEWVKRPASRNGVRKAAAANGAVGDRGPSQRPPLYLPMPDLGLQGQKPGHAAATERQADDAPSCPVPVELVATSQSGADLGTALSRSDSEMSSPGQSSASSGGAAWSPLSPSSSDSSIGASSNRGDEAAATDSDSPYARGNVLVPAHELTLRVVLVGWSCPLFGADASPELKSEELADVSLRLTSQERVAARRHAIDSRLGR